MKQQKSIQRRWSYCDIMTSFLTIYCIWLGRCFDSIFVMAVKLTISLSSCGCLLSLFFYCCWMVSRFVVLRIFAETFERSNYFKLILKQSLTLYSHYFYFRIKFVISCVALSNFRCRPFKFLVQFALDVFGQQLV